MGCSCRRLARSTTRCHDVMHRAAPQQEGLDTHGEGNSDVVHVCHASAAHAGSISTKPAQGSEEARALLAGVQPLLRNCDCIHRAPTTLGISGRGREARRLACASAALNINPLQKPLNSAGQHTSTTRWVGRILQ